MHHDDTTPGTPPGIDPVESLHGNGEVVKAGPDRTGARSVSTEYSRRTRIGIPVFAVAVLGILTLVFIFGLRARHKAETALSQETSRQAQEPMAVDVVHVVPAPAEQSLTLPGEASSFYETTVFARTSGYVKRWWHDIGDHVHEGDVLATIETPELDDQYQAALAKRDELNAQVGVAKTAMDFAEVSYKRWEAAVPEGAVSKQERDQKKTELESSRARLAAAEAQVAVGESEVKRLETLIGFKKVLAPFTGTITRRYVDMGALVTAGSTTNTTPLFRIAQGDKIRVFVDVPQAGTPFIKVGMAAIAEARELPGSKFVGHVDRTSEAVDPQSRTLRVEVLVPNPELKLMPGMYLQVTFQSERAHPPLRIAASALSFGPNGPEVAVVSADGRVNLHPVKIARDLGDFIEIDAGLTENDVVALNVGSQISDGDKVTAHEVDSSPAPASSTRVAAVASHPEHASTTP